MSETFSKQTSDSFIQRVIFRSRTFRGMVKCKAFEILVSSEELLAQTEMESEILQIELVGNEA